jgi:ankyrin repeat protein
VKLLISRGANVNVTNEAGNTPLHWAALLGHTAVVRCLLEAHANVTLQNKAGRTAMEEALSKQDYKTCDEIASFLQPPPAVVDEGSTLVDPTIQEEEEEDAEDVEMEETPSQDSKQS